MIMRWMKMKRGEACTLFSLEIQQNTWRWRSAQKAGSWSFSSYLEGDSALCGVLLAEHHAKTNFPMCRHAGTSGHSHSLTHNETRGIPSPDEEMWTVPFWKQGIHCRWRFSAFLEKPGTTLLVLLSFAILPLTRSPSFQFQEAQVLPVFPIRGCRAGQRRSKHLML